jgi:hypothetical protein
MEAVLKSGEGVTKNLGIEMTELTPSAWWRRCRWTRGITSRSGICTAG